MTVPPYEWPTRMAGLLTRPSVRVTVATSPLSVSRLMLGGQHLVPLRLKGGDHLAKGRAVGPNPVDEHDTRFGLVGHSPLLFVGSSRHHQIRRVSMTRPLRSPMANRPATPKFPQPFTRAVVGASGAAGDPVNGSPVLPSGARRSAPRRHAADPCRKRSRPRRRKSVLRRSRARPNAPCWRGARP